MRCPHCAAEFVPHRGQGTSAAAIKPMKLSGLRLRVYEYLRRHPDGLTDEELIEKSGVNPNTMRPRRVELYAMGKIKDSGVRRQTRSGSEAVVWVAL